MSTPTKTSTALTVVEAALPARPLEDVKTMHATLARLREVSNVILPTSSIDTILPMHKVSFRAVLIDSNVDIPKGKETGTGRHVYKGKFCGTNERALGRTALDLLDAAAGVQILAVRRIDDRSQPFYCEVEVTKGLREYDGTPRVRTKRKAIDLRDGSPAANGLKNAPAVLAEQRSRILEFAETKAGLRVTREILGLQQKYTVDELSKPFVVPKLVPSLDPNDPDQKRALLAMAVGGGLALYGGGQAQPQEGTDILELKEATPPPPQTKTPPPVGTVKPDEEDEGEDLDAGVDPQTSFDMPDLKPDPDPALILCLCPCGHQAEISEQVATVTTEKVGVARCARCFPGRDFDFDAHKDLTRGLQLPKHPDLTPERIRAANEKAAKK